SKADVATPTQGSAPSASDVQSVLNGIAALTNNVLVTGNVGGPYTVEFINNLTGKDATQLTATTVPSSGGPSVAINTLNGAGPTADQVKAHLESIPGIGSG